jgi:hypothetical protein
MLLLTKGNCKAVGIHKGWWPNDLDPVEACFTEYTKQPTRANTPVPDGGILLLFLKWGVVKLITEIFDNTKSDDHPLGWRKCPKSASALNSLQEKLDTFQSLLTYW